MRVYPTLLTTVLLVLGLLALGGGAAQAQYWEKPGFGYAPPPVYYVPPRPIFVPPPVFFAPPPPRFYGPPVVYGHPGSFGPPRGYYGRPNWHHRRHW